jgi:MFS family permease
MPLSTAIGPAWLTRDARIVITTRAFRTFGYGSTSVVLAAMLTEDGDSAAQIGLLLAVAAIGSVLASILMGLFADRFGRRSSLLVTAGLMAGAGLVFAFCESYPVLIVGAFVGTISPSTNDNTPFSGVEQAILAQTCPEERHTAVFAGYNMTALCAGALGGLAVAGMGLVPGVEAGDLAFGVYAVIAVATGVMFLGLSPAAEAPPRGRCGAGALGDSPPANGFVVAEPQRRRLPSGPVLRLSGLFAVDAFAGGLAVQAILALWFQQRYGVSTSELGLLFFATNLLPALSQAFAPTLAARQGLLKAMLLPHFVSNLLLLCVPFAPSFGLAAGILLARQTLSKVDVPARQAFTAAIVEPEERTAAASMTSVARSVAVSASPMTSSLLLSGPLIAFGAPLLLGGGLAIAYDLSMWRSFRHLPVARQVRPLAARLRGRHRAGTAGRTDHAPARPAPDTVATRATVRIPVLDDTPLGCHSNLRTVPLPLGLEGAGPGAPNRGRSTAPTGGGIATAATRRARRATSAVLRER